LCGGDDGALDKVARVLLDVDAAEDDRSSCTVKAPQVHAESPAVGESLLGKRIDQKRVGRDPPVKVRTSTHDTHNGVGAVVGGAKDLGERGRPNADKVADILKVGVASSICDGALHAVVYERGGEGEATLGIAKVGSCRLGTSRVDPKLRRPGVELNGDYLSRSAQGELDGVESSGALDLAVGANLSLGDIGVLAEKGTSLLGDDGVADKSVLLHHPVVVSNENPGAEDGSRQQRRSETSERHGGS